MTSFCWYSGMDPEITQKKPPNMQNEFRPLQIYEQVAEQIRGSIRLGIYAPGTRLPSERELALRLKVSRPAVREAIGALQNEGMVVTRQGSGTYVSDYLPEEAVLSTEGAEADLSPVSIVETRLLFEPAIAKRAALRPSRDPVAESYLARMAGVKDIRDPHQQALWSECDRLFHRQLAVMSGDLLIIRIADEIAGTMAQPLWNRLRDDGIYGEERIQLYVAEHRLIYEAIISGAGDAASFYVKEHLKRVLHDISGIG